MGLFKKISIGMGVSLLLTGMFFFVSHGSAESFREIQETISKTQKWFYMGLFFIWIPSILAWISDGSKVNFSKTSTLLIESILPSFSRNIPFWAQIVRLLSLVTIVYFCSKSVKVIQGQLDIIFDYYWLMVTGFFVFFGAPYMFPKKDES